MKVDARKPDSYGHIIDANGNCFGKKGHGGYQSTPCPLKGCGICGEVWVSPNNGRLFKDGERLVHLSCLVFELRDRVTALEGPGRTP